MFWLWLNVARNASICFISSRAKSEEATASDPSSTSAGCGFLDKLCDCSEPVLSSVQQGQSIPLAGLDVLMHVESLAQGGMLSTCSERVSHCDYHKKKNFFNLKKKSSPIPSSASRQLGQPVSVWEGLEALLHPPNPFASNGTTWGGRTSTRRGQGEVVTVVYVSLQPSVTTPDSQGALHGKILPVTPSQDGGDVGEGRPGGTSRRAKD